MAVQFVSRTKDESVVFAYQTLETTPMAAGGSSLSDRLALQGLDPEGVYSLSGDLEGREITGAVLMASGISVPLSGNYSSKVVILSKK